MTGTEIEILGAGRYDLGESPVWDDRQELLYWTDGLQGVIYCARPDGKPIKSWRFEEAVGSFCLTEMGKILAACETGLCELDPVSGTFTWVFRFDASASNTRLNDGKVAPDGSFVFGSMDRNEEKPLGRAYRFAIDRTVEDLADGFVVFNGPCWSPDGTVFYVSDSGNGRFLRYAQAKDGTLGRPDVLARTATPLTGSFDGAAVDAEGYIWSARVFGGRLTRFTPHGAIDREIALPIRKPTSLCFGGPELSVLFVTSMGAQLAPHFPPDGELGGAILAIHGLGVHGLPLRKCAAC